MRDSLVARWLSTVFLSHIWGLKGRASVLLLCPQVMAVHRVAGGMQLSATKVRLVNWTQLAFFPCHSSPWHGPSPMVTREYIFSFLQIRWKGPKAGSMSQAILPCRTALILER